MRLSRANVNISLLRFHERCNNLRLEINSLRLSLILLRFLSRNRDSWYLCLIRIQTSIQIFILINLQFYLGTFILLVSSFLRRWSCYHIKIQIDMLWRNNPMIIIFDLISTIVVLTFPFILPFLLAIFTQATDWISWCRIHELFTVSLFFTIIDTLLIVVSLFYFDWILHRGRYSLLLLLHELWILLFSLNLLS